VPISDITVTYARELLGRLVKNFGKNIRCPGRVSNHSSPKYESRALQLEPCSSVISILIHVRGQVDPQFLQRDSTILKKAVRLQVWNGPEGSRKLRFPDFMTTAQDGGKVVSVTHRPPLPPGNTPGTHFC